MKIKTLCTVFVVYCALGLSPQASFAGVKIGAGDVNMPSPNLPKATMPVEAAEEASEETTPILKKADVRASPLARSVAELFRNELNELKTGLIEKALINVPSRQKDEYRKSLGREIRIEKLLNLYAQTLEQYYTEAELKSLRTFMADDTNRQMLEKLPTVMTQMGMDRQSYLNQVLEDFLQREFYQKLEKGDPTVLTPR